VVFLVTRQGKERRIQPEARKPQLEIDRLPGELPLQGLRDCVMATIAMNGDRAREHCPLGALWEPDAWRSRITATASSFGQSPTTPSMPPEER